MQINTGQRGFTLLELIVVVAIFAVLSILAYGGLSSVLKTRQGVENSLQQIADLQRAYWRLREDLQQVAPRPATDEFGDTRPALFSELGGSLVLTRGGWRNPLNLPRSSMQRIQYELDEEQLIRKSWRSLDQAPNAEPAELMVMDGVLDLRWRFLGEGSADADSDAQWAESWPADVASGQNNPAAPAPRAIELVLDTKRWGEIRWLFATGLSTAPSS